MKQIKNDLELDFMILQKGFRENHMVLTLVHITILSLVLMTLPTK